MSAENMGSHKEVDDNSYIGNLVGLFKTAQSARAVEWTDCISPEG